MKIETQLLEEQQAKIIVEVEPERMEEAKRRAARKLASRVKIPGFRPGKAPLNVVLRQIGESAVLEEALELFIDEAYPKIIEEAKISPYGPGRLEKIVQMTPPILEFIVPLEATVSLGDYRSLRKEYKTIKVSSKDVNKTLESLRQRQAVIEPVDRPAQEGDQVTVRLSAERTKVDGGQDAVLIQERVLPIIISTPKAQDKKTEAPEWPFPGFSHKLIGHSAGEEITFTYSYPKDFEPPNFQGVDAQFKVVIESVKSRTVPELNDDFAKSLGDFADGGFTDLKTLRSEIRSMLEAEYKKNYDASYDEEILAEAIKTATIKYPPQMLEREIETVIDNLSSRLQRQGLTLEIYLKSRNLDMDGLRAEAKEVAEKQLKQSLYLLELAKAENIQIQPDELESEAKGTFTYLSKVLPEREARQLSDQGVKSNIYGNLMIDMLSRKAMERLRELFSGKLDEQDEASPETIQSAQAVSEDAQSLPVDGQTPAEQPVEQKRKKRKLEGG